MSRTSNLSLALAAIGAMTLCATTEVAQAQRAARSGQIDRSTSQRAGFDQPRPSREVRRNANTNINHNTNVNRNVNRDLNVDVDVHHDYHGHHNHWDDHYHPVARAALVTATAVTTAAIIGSMVNTLPPQCVTVIRYGVSYYQCGSTWYQPTYVGTSVQYVVVVAP